MHSSIFSSRRWTVAGTAVVTIVLVTFVVKSFVLPMGLKPDGVLTEAWMSDLAKVREKIYAENNDPSKHTIFIVAGSNSLFAIASGEIARATGYNVNNYSLHVGLHPDLLFSQITNKIKPGDIVVSPMEWESMQRPLGNVFDVDNYLLPFYRAVSLPWFSAYQIYTSITLKRWWGGLQAYVTAAAGAQRYWDIKPAEQMEVERAHYGGLFSYSYLSLDKDGDFNPHLTMPRSSWLLVGDPRPLPYVGDIEKEILTTWKDRFEKLGAKFFLTTPVLLENRHESFLTESFWSDLEKRRFALQAIGTPLNCDPISAIIASVYRYDTYWHPNITGARIRSRNLASCLAEAIRGKETTTPAIEPQAMIERVKIRIRQQRENFGQGDLPFQIRLRDLTRLRDALEAYHRDNGSYPKSTGLDGVASDWGKRSPDFVEGLVPRYIPALPVDPMGPAATSAQSQFLYWSDGEGYKIIAHNVPDDAAVVAANWPERIDPARLATAGDLTTARSYGFWTNGSDQK